MKRFSIKTVAFFAATVALAGVMTACTWSDFTEKFVGVEASSAAGTGAAVQLPEYVSGQAVELEDYDATTLVTLGQYKGVEVDCTVTDEEIQEQIDELLAAHPNVKKIKEGTAEVGMKVNIDYSGSLDGEKFDGGTAEDQEITLGESGMIDGFDDAIIGMKVGEEKDAPLTFPDDYANNEDLAGKETIFHFKLNYIIEESDATFDDAFVKENTEYKTVDEYKEATRTSLADEKEAAASTTAMEKVIGSSTVSSIPLTLWLAEKEMMRAQTEAQMAQYGITIDYALEMQGMTAEDYENMLQENAKGMSESQLIIEAIALKENISATDEEIKNYESELAESNGTTVDELKESFISYYGYAMDFDRYMRDAYWYDKVVELVGDEAKIIK